MKLLSKAMNSFNRLYVKYIYHWSTADMKTSLYTNLMLLQEQIKDHLQFIV